MRYGILAVFVTFTICTPALSIKAKDEARSRKIMYDYARCVVKKRPSQSAEAILSNANNDAIIKHYKVLLDSECMAKFGGNISMTFGGDIFRYAIADALVNAKYSVSYESDFSNRLPLAHIRPPADIQVDAELGKIKSARKRAAIEKSRDKAGAIGWLSHYGECIVRADPVRSRLWILTLSDTPEEISRINDLRPAFAQCLSEGRLEFSRVIMRGTIAMNYFRLANATPQQTAEKAQ